VILLQLAAATSSLVGSSTDGALEFLLESTRLATRLIASTLDACTSIITLADHALGEQAWAVTRSESVT
jgi:hypothetical protein